MPYPFERYVNTAFSIEDAARECPDGVALTDFGKNYTYGKLNALVHERRAGLYRPAKGRPYILVGDNRLDVFVTLYALLEERIPFLLLHPTLTEHEKEALLKHIHAIDAPIPDGVAAVLMTSGTTGTPKPAMLTRSALAASAWSSAQNIALTKHDAWLMSLSVSRIGGLSILTRSLAARSRVVLFPHFCAREFICALKENAVTLASIVPTMLTKLLKECPDFKPEKSLRVILLGGSFASRTLLDDARGRGIPIVTTYGMTETASNVATSAYTDRLTLGAKARANTFAELSVQNGTLHVRGPMRMAGYWGHPLLREDAWFDTGDIASLDKDGSLTVYARRTDLIVTGGENVYPAEVENILTRITGIREALVLGLPDKTWGAVVTALLVAQSEPLPEKNLKEALVGKLAPYKRPRRIAWVKHLPVNSAGKLNRNPDALTGLILSTLHYTR